MKEVRHKGPMLYDSFYGIYPQIENRLQVIRKMVT